MHVLPTTQPELAMWSHMHWLCFGSKDPPSPLNVMKVVGYYPEWRHQRTYSSFGSQPIEQLYGTTALTSSPLPGQKLHAMVVWFQYPRHKLQQRESIVGFGCNYVEENGGEMGVEGDWWQSEELGIENNGRSDKTWVRWRKNNGGLSDVRLYYIMHNFIRTYCIDYLH